MSRQWTIDDFQRTYEASDNWTCSTYRAAIKLNGAPVKIEVLLENCEANDHAAFIAETISQHINWAVENKDIILDHLAETMTELANEWLEDDDEEEITPQVFRERVQFEQLNLSGTGEFDATIPIEDGNFTIYFSDDDIFAGHTIELWINEGYELDDDPGLMG